MYRSGSFLTFIEACRARAYPSARTVALPTRKLQSGTASPVQEVNTPSLNE